MKNSIKKTLAVAVIGGTLSLSGAGVAQANHVEQQAVAAAGLIAAAVTANDVVDITDVEIVTVDGDVLSNFTVDVRNVRILTGIVVNALNNITIGDVTVTDVVDVTVSGNTLIVVVNDLIL